MHRRYAKKQPNLVLRNRKATKTTACEVVFASYLSECFNWAHRHSFETTNDSWRILCSRRLRRSSSALHFTTYGCSRVFKAVFIYLDQQEQRQFGKGLKRGRWKRRQVPVALSEGVETSHVALKHKDETVGRLHMWHDVWYVIWYVICDMWYVICNMIHSFIHSLIFRSLGQPWPFDH